MKKPKARRVEYVSFEEALPSIARVVERIVSEYHLSPTHLQEHHWHTLNWIIRDLERFIVPNASVAAVRVACGMDLPDIRNFRWRDQARMKDRARKIFHWEHYVPVSAIIKNLLAAEQLCLSGIEAELARMEIWWILKDEDKLLPKHDRPDSVRAYEDNNIIKFVGDWPLGSIT